MQPGTIHSNDLKRAEGRLPRWMFVVASLGAVVTLVEIGSRFAVGFAFGAALAILNYFWLHEAIETLMAAGQAKVPRMVVVKFAVRYPLALAIIYISYRTGWLLFSALLAGLFVPVAGVLTESIFQLVSGLGRLTQES